MKRAKDTSLRIALLLLLGLTGLTGCASDDEKLERAREEGYRQGHRAGIQEGITLGTKDATARYERHGALRGLLIGILLGAGVLALATRKYIAARYRGVHQRRQVKALLSDCETELDDDIYQRVVNIGLRKNALVEQLRQDKSVLVSQLFSSVSYRLKQMDTGIVRLAALLQQLRTSMKNLTGDEQTVRKSIAELRKREETADSALEKEELQQAIAVETLRFETLGRTAENIRRCDLKLSTLSSFLDNLTLSVGNLRTVEEQDSFERFEAEVGRGMQDLESFFERTLGELFTMPKV